MAIKNTVSSNSESVFIDCNERFPLPPTRCDKDLEHFSLLFSNNKQEFTKCLSE